MMSKLRVTAFAFVMAASAYAADVPGFVQTTLVTNTTDPDLVNPWGVSFSATSPFWVSDAGTGKATLYNSAGVKNTSLIVSMPAGSFSVTGQVFNGTTNFNGDNFVFATNNGTITGWRGALGSTAETLFTQAGADYTGLAISATKTTLYAANFATGKIDVFGSAGLTGSFADPSAPAGYAPYNVQNINGTLYVTYAPRGTNGRSVAGAGNGYVSIFNPTTDAFTRVTTGGVLNDPWGVAIAPAGFGNLGGDLLVGNFGDGTINAFDTLGNLIGTIAGITGTPIVDQGLWSLNFGNGGSGGLTSSLYITAGPNNETGGLFAQISTAPEPSTWALGICGVVALLVARRRSAAR
jgi:uncharacterized protein (TIGR03118 family)